MRFDECMAVLNLSPLVYVYKVDACMYVCIKWNVCSILKMITYGLNVCMLINTSIGTLACMYVMYVCINLCTVCVCT